MGVITGVLWDRAGLRSYTYDQKIQVLEGREVKAERVTKHSAHAFDVQFLFEKVG